MERVVDVGLAVNRYGLTALGHDAERQGLDLFPGRPDRAGEPVDRQARPDPGNRTLSNALVPVQSARENGSEWATPQQDLAARRRLMK